MEIQQVFGTNSLAESIALLPPDKRQATLLDLSEEDAARLLYDWEFWARPSQIEPEGDWLIWFIQTGRGWGKTLTGSQTTRKRADNATTPHIGLVGPTAADVRDIMVEGESGILPNASPWNKAVYLPSKRKVKWENGVYATMYSAEDPDQLRGPQHGFVWGDEIAAWQKAVEVWSNLLFGLRRDETKLVITSTPRPNRIIKMLHKDPTCVITRGSTYENISNLPLEYIQRVINPYKGTRKGRQEIEGEVLSDTPGALWSYSMIDDCRVAEAPHLARIVTAIDPAVTSNPESAETGIVTVGLSDDQQLYVIGDASSRESPDTWTRQAIEAFNIHQADRIVGETNNGGDLIEALLRTQEQTVSYANVFASRGKTARAEPVSALYEQFRVHHVGTFSTLEDQMTEFVAGEKNDGKDRVDALVWACSYLMPNLGKRLRFPAREISRRPIPLFSKLRQKSF